jgi:hypothetical protein
MRSLCTPVEEPVRVAVLGGRFPFVDGRDVGGKLRLLERALGTSRWGTAISRRGRRAVMRGRRISEVMASFAT